MTGLLRTSEFIAKERVGQLSLASLPEEAAVSVVTPAELELGTHVGETPELRPRRLSTPRAVQTTCSGLPVDEHVASNFARIVADSRGRPPSHGAGQLDRRHRHHQ